MALIITCLNVTGGLPQGLTEELIWYNASTTNQEVGTGCILSKFTDNPKQHEWLMHQIVVLPFRETWTGWKTELRGISLSRNAFEEEQAHTPIHSGDQQLGNCLHKKRSENPDRQQAE